MDDPVMVEFERRLAARLTRYADVPVPPIDAAAVAGQVVRGRRWPWQLAARPDRARTGRVSALAWLVIVLALALTAAALSGAILRLVRPPGTPPLVLATGSGLFLADGLGGDRRLLRDDGTYVEPRWSPAGDRIAVLHRPAAGPRLGGNERRAAVPRRAPTSLVLDDAGTNEFAVPGPVLDFAWGPPAADGRSRLAVGTADGRVAVLDATGAPMATIQRDSAGVSTGDVGMLPPGLAWASADVLLAVSGDEVIALDVRRPIDILGDREGGGRPGERDRALAGRRSPRLHLGDLPRGMPG